MLESGHRLSIGARRTTDPTSFLEASFADDFCKISLRDGYAGKLTL
jgi:hypothetical protein